MLQKSLLLVGIHYVESILWLMMVTMAVVQARRLFLKSMLWRWLDSICEILLIDFGVLLAFEYH